MAGSTPRTSWDFNRRFNICLEPFRVRFSGLGHHAAMLVWNFAIGDVFFGS